MARPFTVQDDAILDAAERAIAAQGPSAFTLADVAAPLGVSAQALLHRFGSKHALVLAVAARRGRVATAAIATAMTPGDSPLAAMLAFFEQRMRSRDYTRKTLSAGFAFMLAGASDAAIRPHIVTQVAAIRANLYAFISAAVDAGELRGDAERIAELVEVVYNGATYMWLIERQGTAWDYFEPKLTAVLAPYTARRKAPRLPRSRRPSRRG